MPSLDCGGRITYDTLLTDARPVMDCPTVGYSLNGVAISQHSKAALPSSFDMRAVSRRWFADILEAQDTDGERRRAPREQFPRALRSEFFMTNNYGVRSWKWCKG